MRSRLVLVWSVAVMLLAAVVPALAHEPAPGPFPLAGEYAVEVMTEPAGTNSWVFTYTITNLTELGDYSNIGGLPEEFDGIDPTGLGGFFVLVPEDSVISNVVVPDSYREGGSWSYLGRWEATSSWGYEWAGFWGNWPPSIYPIGVPLSLSFQIDDVQVGSNIAQLTTYFHDHAIRYGTSPERYTDYQATLPSPVPLVEDLLTDLVAEIELLNLGNGISNSLDAKLDNALKALEDVNEHNDVAAINKLQAFINEVEAQAGDKIPQADADTLVAAAQQIIDQLIE